MKTSCTKVSYVSPLVDAFFLFPFIKVCNFLRISPTNAQFLKVLCREIAISSKAKAKNTLSLASKMDPLICGHSFISSALNSGPTPRGSFPSGRWNGSINQWVIDGTDHMLSPVLGREDTELIFKELWCCLRSQASHPLATTFHVNPRAVDSVLMRKERGAGAVRKGFREEMGTELDIGLWLPFK